MAWRTDIAITPQQEDFLEWLVDPDREGSQAEYARKIGLTSQTLSRWKRDREFRDRWYKRLEELNVRPDRVQEVLETLFKKATRGQGDTTAAVKYLDYTEKILPPRKQATIETAASDMTDDELAEALEKAANSLRGSNGSK